MKFLVTTTDAREVVVEADVYELPSAGTDADGKPIEYSPLDHAAFYVTKPHKEFGQEGQFELMDPPIFSVAMAGLVSIEVTDKGTIIDEDTSRVDVVGNAA